MELFTEVAILAIIWKDRGIVSAGEVGGSWEIRVDLQEQYASGRESGRVLRGALISRNANALMLM